MKTLKEHWLVFLGLAVFGIGTALVMLMADAQTTNSPGIVDLGGTGSPAAQLRYISVDTNGVLVFPAGVYGPFYFSNQFSFIHTDGSVQFRQDNSHPGVTWDGTGNGNLYTLTVGNGDTAHGAGALIAHLAGDGRSITNQILSGPTNSSAPGNTSSIKVWANFVDDHGNTFKLPLYQ